MERVGLFLDDSFPMLPLAGLTDVMRLANYFSGKDLYEWSTISRSDAPVISASGLRLIADTNIDEAETFDRIVVGSETDFSFDDPKITAWLRSMKRRGVAIGSVATGTWILAKSGLLDGKKCTINPTNWAAFGETYPTLDLTTNLFVIDGRIFTCAGGTSAIDMFLSFVSIAHGADLALAVADSILHARIRPAHGEEITAKSKLALLRPEVRDIVRRMEGAIENPVPISVLADEVNLSQRHLVRLFRHALGQPPAQYYLTIRLSHAARLLTQTSLSISEISNACGFGSITRFSTAYRSIRGVSPREERRMVASGMSIGPIS